MTSLIVAIDENNAIGKAGDMLCHLPNDLRYFKEKTSGHTVIMGKKTLLSLPKRPLPNRRNIVLTSQPEDIAGVEWAISIEEAMKIVQGEEEVFVMGGGMVYKQFMTLADKLYITHIHHAFEEADTYFPLISPDEWQLVSTEEHPADEKHAFAYAFAIYTRK